MKRKRTKADQSKIVNELIPGSEREKERSKEKRKQGRPSLLTPELREKLIRLFEDHFFIAIVAAKADIYKARIYEWERDREDFRNEVTHAQDKWTAHEMEELEKDAKDKRYKDWRARKYKLSISDAEYNDKKFLREAPGSGRMQSITIIINQKDLSTSKKQAYDLIGESKLEAETVSLITFESQKKGKEHKRRQITKTEKAKT